MQLERSKNKRIAGTLGLVTASLFAHMGVHAQTPAQDNDAPIANPQPISEPKTSEFDDDTYTDTGLIRIDGAVLVYQEDDGRVQAIEPVLGVTFNFDDESSLSLKLTADILTGASPYGATPWSQTQTLIDPPATGASSVDKNTVTSTDVPPDVLPLATGFNDKRYAVDVGYTSPWGGDDTLSISAGISTETDYQSYYGNVGYSHEFNKKNTTFTASANFEYDISSPSGGHPRPLTVANGVLQQEDESKTVIGGLVGISQIVNRRWLAELNYNISTSSGYQTDPYRIISVVDANTGGPLRYLYESRPESRLRQSLYFGNKIALGGTVTDASARAYHDDWGIDSITLNLATRIPLSKRLYVKPGVRYYNQTSADFFNAYLLGGQAFPEFASSDSRLDKFSALTGSLMLGFRTSRTGEIYGRFSRYTPSGKTDTSSAPGYLSGRDLFSGTSSTSLIIGYSYAFK